MKTSARRSWGFGAVLSIGAAMFAPAHGMQPPDEEPTGRQAQPRLVTEASAAQPGKTLFLGVHFQIDRGWHLYWPGQNDSGMAVEVDLKLPAGWKAGDIQWPAPRRHVAPGGILDHAYFDRVTLLVPVEVPAGAKPGTRAKIEADLEWMVCKDSCEIGEQRVAIEVPVVAADAEAAPSTDVKLFEQTRARLAKPLPSEGAVRAELKGGKLVVALKGGGRMAFYPHEDGAAVEDALGSCLTTKGRLEIVLAETGAIGPPVRGILEVAGEKGPEFYWIELPAATRTAPKGEPAATQPSAPVPGKP